MHYRTVLDLIGVKIIIGDSVEILPSHTEFSLLTRFGWETRGSVSKVGDRIQIFICNRDGRSGILYSGMEGLRRLP